MKKPRKHPKFHPTKKIKRKSSKGKKCCAPEIQNMLDYDYFIAGECLFKIEEDLLKKGMPAWEVLTAL